MWGSHFNDATRLGRKKGKDGSWEIVVVLVVLVEVLVEKKYDEIKRKKHRTIDNCH